MQLVNPFTVSGNFYKANLHTHTTNSDGAFSPSERVEQYKSRGYQVLAITDHEHVTQIEEISGNGLLLIRALETHPQCPPDGEVYHLVCLNVPRGFQMPADADANTRISLVRQAGGEVIFAHPYWCGHNIVHMNRVNGFIAVEVFNTTCTNIGKGLSSVHWDDNLDEARVIGGVAVDDSHGTHDQFQGWTMIKAESLDTDSIMNSLRTGCYYSSTGPVIEHFEIAEGIAVLRCSPASEIRFVGRRSHGGVVRAQQSDLLTSASIEANPHAGYLRAEVVDSQGHVAWTNPIFL